MFTTTVSRPVVPHFTGKDKQKHQPAEVAQAPEPDDTFEAAQQPVMPSHSKQAFSMLEKMFSGWGIGGQTPETKKAKTRRLTKSEEGNRSASSAMSLTGEAKAKDAANKKQARFHVSGFRATVPSGTRIKKNNPSKQAPALQRELSNPGLSPKLNLEQELRSKRSLAPIREDDESLLGHSLPNVAAPLSQLLSPPPQLPSALENFTELLKLRPDTPASSLWAEDTNGSHSRVTASIAPSRAQEPEEDSEGSYDSDSDESLRSDTSSAFLVDDDEEVLSERERGATRKWAKAVKSQKLGTFVAQKVAKPDIHQNARYLEGDSDLDSDDQALYYDSEGSFTDSESEDAPNKPVKETVNRESLLTNIVADPRFNLVTEYQKSSKTSNDYIAAATTSQKRSRGEKRVQELLQRYSPEQLIEIQGKLAARRTQIQANKNGFMLRLKVPAGMSLSEQVDIRQHVLNNLTYETKQHMEALVVANKKGKMPEHTAKAQWKALQEKMATIQLRQQQLDSAVGVFSQLEANESQITDRLAIYREAIRRATSQAVMKELDRVSKEELGSDQKVDLWNGLGHQYPSAELIRVKAKLLQQDDADKTLKLEMLDRALSMQVTMSDNIFSRIKASFAHSKDQDELARQLSSDFSKVELTEALRKLSLRQDSELTQQGAGAILHQALRLHPDT